MSLGDFALLLPADDNHVLRFLIWQNGSFHQLSSSPFDSISLRSVLLKMTKNGLLHKACESVKEHKCAVLFTY